MNILRLTKSGLVGGVTMLLVMLYGTAFAQEAPRSSSTSMSNVSPADEPSVDRNSSSGEQGQSSLSESFDWHKRAKLIREQRGTALSSTRYNAELRSMHLDRNKYDSSESEAWAVGGSAGLRTGRFRERVALGITGYTSQRLYGPGDKDGTRLLKSGQESYTVLGELYGDILIVENLHLNVGRKGYDTPYINRNDTRMTPNTFEAITFQGKAGTDWSYGGGYFDQIKDRNSDEFVSMSKSAGAGVDRGVYTGGGLFKHGDFSLGAIDYYSDDIINIAYVEATHTIPLPSELKVKLAVQYTDQQSTGDDLLKGEDFSADQFGVKADLPLGGATFTVAYTDTGSGANMQNPWSGCPSFTSVQGEDFNRAGEAAFMLRTAYSFSIIQGLSAYALWVNGTEPDDPAQYKRDEYDLNLQWKASEGLLKGMMLRGRYALVTQDGDDGEDLGELRLMCYYDLSSCL